MASIFSVKKTRSSVKNKWHNGRYGARKKAQKVRAAIRFKTNVQAETTSASVQLGRVMNGAPNEPRQFPLENNSITHQAGEV